MANKLNLAIDAERHIFMQVICRVVTVVQIPQNIKNSPQLKETCQLKTTAAQRHQLKDTRHTSLPDLFSLQTQWAIFDVVECVYLSIQSSCLNDQHLFSETQKTFNKLDKKQRKAYNECLS
ncbi:6141_t:CDS:2 [Paraglomus brasilianum]|uniref:6141_t:CDS:1 n=1 Tax=Paraglomus brasilianum TaxID=144538 RepID=A0A9N9BMD4_9GLOM|nr:6141_t:CDS:2 [Paraglomus brasilianum]